MSAAGVLPPADRGRAFGPVRRPSQPVLRQTSRPSTTAAAQPQPVTIPELVRSLFPENGLGEIRTPTSLRTPAPKTDASAIPPRGLANESSTCAQLSHRNYPPQELCCQEVHVDDKATSIPRRVSVRTRGIARGKFGNAVRACGSPQAARDRYLGCTRLNGISARPPARSPRTTWSSTTLRGRSGISQSGCPRSNRDSRNKESRSPGLESRRDVIARVPSSSSHLR
jgi:hypothetical protein